MIEQAEIEQPAQPSALTLAVQKVSTELAGFDKIAAGLEELHKEHPVDVVLDVTAAEGMKQAIKSRAAWRDPRIAIEKVRKAAKAPVLQLGKDIDSFAAELTEKLQAGELHYDGMIQAELTRKAELKKQEEERERARVDAIQRRIATLFGDVTRALFNKDAATIEQLIQAIVGEPIGDEYAEFKEHAEAAKNGALTELRTMLAAQREREAEAERQRLQAEENARQAAELAKQRAEFEALQKKAREEQEAREAADRAARDKVEREQREQREERERIAAEQKKLDDAKRAAEEAKAAEERRKADEAAAAERKRLDEEAAQQRAAAAARAEEERKAAEAARKAEEERIAKEEAKRAKAARKLAAAQKAGPRLLAAASALAAVMMRPEAAQVTASVLINSPEFSEVRAAIAEGEAA